MSEGDLLQPEESSCSVLGERRAWVRYASHLEATCHAVGALRDAGWPARMWNISAGGVGLLLKHRFKPGSPLLVELRSPSGSLQRVVQARVVHATAVMVQGEHRWLIGCAFANPLSDEEVQALR